MTRGELADKAYKIIMEDMGGTKTPREIWVAIAKSNDAELINFVCSKEKR